MDSQKITKKTIRLKVWEIEKISEIAAEKGDTLHSVIVSMVREKLAEIAA